MAKCKHVPKLPYFEGNEKRFRGHILECKSCRLMAGFFASVLDLPQEKSPVCPDTEKLEAYRMGKLPMEEREEIRKHLYTCGFCLSVSVDDEEWFEQIRILKSILAEVEKEQPGNA